MNTKSTNRTALALVGNPGVGKSTILNGLAGGTVFKSGVAIGTGLTTKFEQREAHGGLLFDTLGLADIERQKDAGREIDQMLSEPVDVKICFVIIIGNGGIWNSDALTVDLFLRAILQDVDNKFGVIVNQVTKALEKEISNPAVWEKIKQDLSRKCKTNYWLRVPMKHNIQDVDDSMLVADKLCEFLNEIPVTKLKSTRVVPVDAHTIEEKQDLHEKRIEAISDEQKVRIMQMAEQHQKEQEEMNQHIQKLLTKLATCSSVFGREGKENMWKVDSTMLSEIGESLAPIRCYGRRQNRGKNRYQYFATQAFRREGANESHFRIVAVSY